MDFEQTVLRGNERQFVEDAEAQGREFLATSEEERFMELVILEEQAERVIVGEDYRRSSGVNSRPIGWPNRLTSGPDLNRQRLR